MRTSHHVTSSVAAANHFGFLFFPRESLEFFDGLQPQYLRSGSNRFWSWSHFPLPESRIRSAGRRKRRKLLNLLLDLIHFGGIGAGALQRTQAIYERKIETPQNACQPWGLLQAVRARPESAPRRLRGGPDILRVSPEVPRCPWRHCMRRFRRLAMGTFDAKLTLGYGYI